MYLKRLDILGFKTFAARTVFEFRPGITAIVGPNGSGKSNVADAVRWVLGEQSYSAIRSRRAEDVIFSGGGRRAASGFAEVSLTIDNSDRLLPLPYNEVTITRRASRSGENEYQINRQRVRLRDVQEAVGPLGGSYTIINQGLVDAALNLRPEERRRLFEDAAEIGVYEQRKSEALRRLRETAANIQRCDDVLTELEPRMRSLKRQASLARGYRDLQQELQALLGQYYLLQRRSLRSSLAFAEQHEREAATLLQSARIQQAAAADELQLLRESLRGLRDRLASLHQTSSGLHERAEATQRELVVGIERATALERRADDLAHQQTDIDLRRTEQSQERQLVLERQQAASQRLAQEREAAAAHETVLTGHTQALQAARQALQIAQRDELHTTTALADVRRRQEQLAVRKLRLVEELSALAPALAAAQQNLEQSRVELHQAEEAVAQALDVLAQAEQALSSARATIEASRAELRQLDEHSAQLQRSLADVEARLESLTRLQRSYTGVFAGVKAAMQWAEREKRLGFVLVASILRTPAELETAIEVALGSRLQNIVVDHWQDAEDAIEALRRSNAGRATFLPLDSLKSQIGEHRSRQRSDAVLGLAAELVDTDQRYAVVVWQLLGRTLVVRDLPTARAELRELSGGWTIVTLAGEQVNSGGAVTGGSQVRESGALRRERELRELPERASSIRAEIALSQQQRQALLASIAGAEQARREAEQRQRLALQERDAAQKKLEQERRRLGQAEGDLLLQQRRSAQIEQEQTELEQQLAQLSLEEHELERRSKQLQEELALRRVEEQAWDERDREAQQQLAGLRAAVAAAEAELRTEQALLRAAEQNLARLQEQQLSISQRQATLSHEQTALLARNQELDAIHNSLLVEIDSLRQNIEPLEAQLSTNESAQNELEQRMTGLTNALLEAESAHGHASMESQRSRDRLDALWERAAADDIDLDDLGEGLGFRDQGLGTGDQGSGIGGQGSGIVNRGSETGDHGSHDRRADASSPDATIYQNPLDDASAARGIPDARGTTPATPGDASNRLEDSQVINIDELQARIQSLRSRIQRMGVINPLALEEYEEASQRYSFMSTQLADLRAAETALTELISELEGAMQLRFQQTFKAVAAEFERTFERLFGGGQAQLVLTQPGSNGTGEENGQEHDAVIGVDILARPPGKRQQNLALLSGGERALTAGALLFAILTVNPSPFCVMDEVDAALDEANVGRFREALAELSLRTQFLVITHNRGTIEAADTIYGVSMGDDSTSKVLSLRMEEVVE